MRKYTPLLFCCLIMFSATASSSTAPSTSIFESELQKIRYNLSDPSDFESGIVSLDKDFGNEEPPPFDVSRGRKSPAKAFLLSLAVPGLGQYYYGSKVKTVLCFGAEVTAWAMYFNWHGEGENLTDEYEAFNVAHWSRDAYEQEYLYWAYGVTDDEDVPSGTAGITHHLPDDKTQQYYEMTGKYDQFSWGWDDAILDGNTLGPDVEPIVSESTAPYSARRLEYETMRDAANSKFDKATRMIFVAMANRLISAFEAMISTKSLNKKSRPHDDEFGGFRLKAKLKSVYTKRDTPYVSLTYKF